MYKASTYGPRQGPRRRLGHAARARHPRRRGQLRLRHHQARQRAVGRPPAVDRRHALPGAAPAGAPGARRGEVGRVRDRPPAQVLPHHEGRARAARGPARTVAGGGRHAARHLDEGAARHDAPPPTTRRSRSRSRSGAPTCAAAGPSTGPDVEELEGHLRDQVAALTQAGLAEDEAFLVAVKRMGSLDALSREFAREHSERLWKQLVMAPDAGAAAATPPRTRDRSWS